LNSKHQEKQVSIDNVETEVLNKLESDTYFNGDDIQKTFLKAVHQLPQKQQMVFNLKYFKEMKYEEMSEIFGTSIGALKASYHHAVKKIEDFLEKHI
jgi:RNA polymerase sigma-70 factor (ECF subfamily)